MRRTAASVGLLLLLFIVTAVSAGAAPPSWVPGSPPGTPPPTAKHTASIQLLTISDWHGQLTPVSGVGGAAFLKTYFDQARAENPNTLLFTAGDAIGATPPISSFFE